ncbi:EAL domain-containing protein [Vibrio fluvialis]|uniref:EAL domain-containing protein n=1 Tax=Vibrio fluvialis TaxID=676 RepID=UPI001F3BC2D2|nr:cyclic diguanylate phosphodiesterase [Vibrio fluvialis]MCE7594567.1 cyclic diguanylate phosphodiesterase [Vibrio fluvialis]
MLKRVAMFLAAFALTLGILEVTTYYLQQDEQIRFAKEVLDEAEQATEQISDALHVANTILQPSCDHATMTVIRQLVHENSEIYDIGLMEGDSVLCSANWGVFDPVNVADKFQTAFKGYRFYTQVDHLFPVDDKYDLTRLNQFVTLTVPDQYQHLMQRMPKFRFSVESATDEHVFTQYTPGNDYGNPFPPLSIKTKTCSDRFNYCVHTHNAKAGLANYSAHVLLALLAIALLFSFLLAYSFWTFISRHNSIEHRFREALSQKKLYMEYQPVVTVKDKRIAGVESLVRWEDNQYGRVSPELFIGIAEKLSLYPQLAYFVAERSISEMAPILQENPGFSLGINIAAFELQDPQFLPFLSKLTLELSIQPSQIKIEITERIDLPLSELADFSRRAKSMGFMVVLDDFGTGVANLVWLTEMDFDFIKVNRVFVNALNYDMKRNIVRPVMDLITGLNKQVVFEGVETEHEFKIIEENCPWGYIQGWYFYKSMPKSELDAVLARDNA